RARRNGAVHLDDSARSRDGGSDSGPLPLILEHGEGDLPDGADFFHDAQPGRAIGGVALDGAAAAWAPLPPPLHRGGRSTASQPFLSGSTRAARTFLSGQLSPVNSPVVLSFFGPPFS